MPLTRALLKDVIFEVTTLMLAVPRLLCGLKKLLETLFPLVLVLLPVSALADTLSGTVSELMVENFEISERQVYLTTESQTIRLHFNLPSPTELRTGMRVVLEGQFNEDGSFLVESVENIGLASKLLRAVSGNLNALAILVDFSDATVSCTETEIANDLWDGAQNLNSFYQEASYGTVAFPRDADGNTSADVVRVSIAASASGTCDYASDVINWTNQAATAAAAEGYTLSLYDHVILYLPSTVNCGWAGLGLLGCGSNCTAWSKACGTPDVILHEVGHNLGLHHASDDTDNDGSIDCEYCDTSCPMGYGGIGYRNFNSPHKHHLGWIPDSRVNAVSTSGDYTLATLDSATAPTENQILTLADENSTDTFYISYRERNNSYNNDLPSSFDGTLQIHRRPAGGDNHRSLLVASLSPSESRVLGSNTVSFSSGASGTAQVAMAINSTPTATPTPSSDPDSDSGDDPTLGEFTLNVYASLNKANSKARSQMSNNVKVKITTSSGSTKYNLTQMDSDPNSFYASIQLPAEDGIEVKMAGMKKLKTTASKYQRSPKKYTIVDGSQYEGLSVDAYFTLTKKQIQ